MVIIVESKTLPITQALRHAVETQAQHITRLSQKIILIRVSLETIAKKKNDTQASIAQFMVEIPGKNIIVRKKAQDLYVAVTQAAQRAAQQLIRTQKKHLKARRIPENALTALT